MPVIQTLLFFTSKLCAPTVIVVVPTVLVLSLLLYRIFLHPLAHVPGPLSARVSPAFLYIICYFGIEGRALAYYHRKYNTPVLRVAPNAVSLSDGASLHPVYIAGGGLPKDARYRNFRIEGHDTIFSAIDQAYRDARAKAVMPLFAPSRIRAASENQGVIHRCVQKFVYRLEKERAAGKADILDLSSRLSIDVLTGYLFDTVYGGLDEKYHDAGERQKLSATPFVLAIVAFARVSLFPNWLFSIIFSTVVRYIFTDRAVTASLQKVERFVAGVMKTSKANSGSKANDGTYQGRLLSAGISESETLIQCKAAMFAGADSTAVKLATLLFHLVQQPEVRHRLREEFQRSDPTADPQTLPYLRAVIREGLRLGMANPARLTRIVPPSGGGITVGGFYLPPGTVVGASAYVLHHNPEVFPQPFEFRPEYWLDDNEDNHARDQKMSSRRVRERDTFPFGLGSRVCVGRNLATHQLFVTVKAVVESGVLEGATTCKERIELIEWFNVEIKGHELEIQWTR